MRLNQIVSDLDFVSEIFVYPHMGDGGLPAGAALEYFFKNSRQFQKLDDVYLGPVTPPLGVADERNHPDLAFEYFDDHTFAIAAAEDLAQQQTVALVRGAMEYGPRALGNRSLLFDAREASVNDWLNKKLSRSEFMPFAPLLKEEHVEKFFHGTKKVTRCLPFMTTTLQVTSACAEKYKGVVHRDKTARPQVVSKKTNPVLWNILDHYETKTGNQMLINTSYNVHEEPIVFEQNQAIKSFKYCKLDSLFYGNSRIRFRR